MRTGTRTRNGKRGVTELRHRIGQALRGSVLLLLAGIATRPAAAVQEPYQPHYCKDAFSYSQEIAEGRKAEQQVYKQMKVLPDSSPITQYVQQLGAKLVAVAPGYKFPYRFHVVDSKEINAFALPGGAVFVNTGTILAAQNESELAGVMAHEISHVVQRHSTCNQTKQAKSRVGWGLLGALAGVVVPGMGGALAEEGVGMAQNLSYLHMSRTDEQEADLLGTEILYDAGYDPHGLVKMFQIIEQKYGAGGAQFLSDHPNPGNRVEYVDKEIAQLPPRAYEVVDTPEFDRIHALLASGQTGASATAASSPASGAATREVSASATLTPYVHAGYSLSYPSDWKVYGDSSSAVTIAPPSGILTDSSGGDQVVYGAMIDVYAPPASTSLSAGTQAILSRLQQSNPHLRASGAMQQVLVNQQPGESIEMDNTSPLSANGHAVAEKDWLVTVQRPDGSIDFLVFVAPASDYAKLHPAFVNILRSFHVEKDAQK